MFDRALGEMTLSDNSWFLKEGQDPVWRSRFAVITTGDLQRKARSEPRTLRRLRRLFLDVCLVSEGSCVFQLQSGALICSDRSSEAPCTPHRSFTEPTAKKRSEWKWSKKARPSFSVGRLGRRGLAEVEDCSRWRTRQPSPVIAAYGGAKWQGVTQRSISVGKNDIPRLNPEAL